ncbi:MAG TPA: hypothetical protein VLC92_11655 [Rhodocyclaceae bacterium]|nr:hypothetical protein [Rhodocyclaceae bacterium]
MNISKIIMVGAALCLTPLPAFADDDAGSAGDGDRPITYTMLTFEEVDRNRDGAINQTEQRDSTLSPGVFVKMDRNADKVVSEAEFDAFQATTLVAMK